MKQQSSRWAHLGRTQALSIHTLQPLLDPETILLEFSLGVERSFLFKATHRGIESFALPGQSVLEQAAREVYEALRIYDPRAIEQDHEAALRLSERILGPVADELGHQRLVIVADGALEYLPFAALPHPAAPDEPLLMRHELVVLPSISILGLLREGYRSKTPKDPRKTIAILADPVFDPSDDRFGEVDSHTVEPSPSSRSFSPTSLERLGWSGFEAQAISSLAGIDQTSLALGFDANLEAVMNGGLLGHRIVHFATHGQIDSEHPELSALVLSLYDANGQPREGLLRLPQIYHLDLDADLVVLSGCRTALGPQIRGEGLVGLTHGFFAAGARHLVASLWRAQDHSTAELMKRFYRFLLQDSTPRNPQQSPLALRPVAALRAAQLELLADPRWRDPYHWAAFAFYGDWR